MASREDRITAYSAIGTAVLFLPMISIAIAYPAPDTGASAGEITGYLTIHRTSLIVALYLTSFAWGGLLIVFAGGLWAILRRAEGGTEVWSTIALVACAVTSAAILVVDTLSGAMLYRAPLLDAASLPLLSAAVAVANLMTAFPNAVYVIAAGIVILRTGVMPRWVAFGAFLVATIHLTSAMSWARAGAFAPLGVLPSVAPLSHAVWLACIGAVLLRSGRSAERGVRLMPGG